MRNIRKSIRTLGIALLLAGGIAHAEEQSFFQALAGPGEKVNLTAKTLDMKTLPDGSLERFTGTDRVVLESPKLNLKADNLTYVAAEGILRATGSVSIDQTGVKATAETLVYDIEGGEMTLTGNPRVEQDTPQNRSVFDGMQEFRLKTLESGETEIRMSGGEQIDAEITTKTPETSSAVPAAAASGGGFAGLGNDVKIQTRAGTDQAPEINVTSGGEGGIGSFQALGSVVLKSDQMDLRADVLEFNQAANMVEALYDVYMKQEGIDADAGRMVYDLADERITLSVDPNVRRREAGGMWTISDMDRFIISREADGSTNTNAIGVDKDPVYSWEAAETTTTSTAKDTSPREIRLDNPEDLTHLRNSSGVKITPTPKPRTRQ